MLLYPSAALPYYTRTTRLKLSDNMPHYKLKYFDGRGRAETIRMLFKLGKTEFEDSRCEMDEWPQIKPSKILTKNNYIA